jgi:hypothetical protein
VAAALTAATPAAAAHTAATCTAHLQQNCGPYADPSIPMSNGYNTYVINQDVGANPGTTQTITATSPAAWSLVADDVPHGYTGVQTFDAVQQLTNDWCGSVTNWSTCPKPTDTPLASLPSLTVTYTETSPTDAGSIYEFAPDIWSSYSSDVMFWADTSPARCTDNGLSASDILGQATLAGQHWTVYRYGGAGSEIIFILGPGTDPVDAGTCATQRAGTIHIKAGFNWLVKHGIVHTPVTLSQANTGWEVTSADSTTFAVSRYSIADN